MRLRHLHFVLFLWCMSTRESSCKCSYFIIRPPTPSTPDSYCVRVEIDINLIKVQVKLFRRTSSDSKSETPLCSRCHGHVYPVGFPDVRLRAPRRSRCPWADALKGADRLAFARRLVSARGVLQGVVSSPGAHRLCAPTSLMVSTLAYLAVQTPRLARRETSSSQYRTSSSQAQY